MKININDNNKYIAGLGKLSGEVLGEWAEVMSAWTIIHIIIIQTAKII